MLFQPTLGISLSHIGKTLVELKSHLMYQLARATHTDEKNKDVGAKLEISSRIKFQSKRRLSRQKKSNEF